jgi:hypothetical protein
VSADRSRARLARALERAEAIVPSRVASEGAVRALDARAARPLEQLVAQALRWIGELDAGPGADEIEDSLERWISSADDAGPAPAAAPPSELAAVCFAARIELGGVRRDLAALAIDPEVALATCEAAAHKIQRTLRAIVAALATSHGRAYTAADQAGETGELGVAEAITVRTLYARFRVSLIPYDVADRESLAIALARAAAALRNLCGGPAFAHVRLADRSVLRALRRRVEAWLGHGGESCEGVRLYQDIVTTANVLRGINTRQELLAYDARVITDVLGGLARAVRGDEAEVSRLGVRLESLRGRDDQLDAVLERMRKGEELRDLAGQVVRHLGRLADDLPMRAAA